MENIRRCTALTLRSTNSASRRTTLTTSLAMTGPVAEVATCSGPRCLRLPQKFSGPVNAGQSRQVSWSIARLAMANFGCGHRGDVFVSCFFFSIGPCTFLMWGFPIIQKWFLSMRKQMVKGTHDLGTPHFPGWFICSFLRLCDWCHVVNVLSMVLAR
jgi:hypothetical protein